MKTHLWALLVFCLAAVLHAQTPVPVADANRTPEELEQMLAPIALYPDALVALILPAATVPTDIVLAARFLSAHGPAAHVDGQPWDESVRALAHYPDIVKWMDENLEWTLTLGAAFTQQPVDVMNAIQRLRAKARAEGVLIDTPQQRVVLEDDAICIEPVQPDVIYVPIYDPELMFWGREPLLGRPYLTFGLGYSIGVWLNFDCDWHRHNVWVRQHPRDWNRRPEPGRPPTIWRPDNDGHAWRPPPLGRPRFNVPMAPDQRHEAIPRPRPMSETRADRPRPPFNAEPDSRLPGERDRAPAPPANRPSPPQANAPAPGQRPVPPSAPQGGPHRDGNDRPDPMPAAIGDHPRPARNAEPDSRRPGESDRVPAAPTNRPSPPQANAPAPGQPPFVPRGESRREGIDRPDSIPDRRPPSAPPSPPPPPMARPAAPPPPPAPPAATQPGNNNPPPASSDRDQK